jgi:hypothetical protein
LLGEQKQIDRVCGSMAKKVFFVPWQATSQIGLPAPLLIEATNEWYFVTWRLAVLCFFIGQQEQD